MWFFNVYVLNCLAHWVHMRHQILQQAYSRWTRLPPVLPNRAWQLFLMFITLTQLQWSVSYNLNKNLFVFFIFRSVYTQKVQSQHLNFPPCIVIKKTLKLRFGRWHFDKPNYSFSNCSSWVLSISHSKAEISILLN